MERRGGDSHVNASRGNAVRASRLVPSLMLMLGVVVGSVAYREGAPQRPVEPGMAISINCPPPNPQVIHSTVSDC